MPRASTWSRSPSPATGSRPTPTTPATELPREHALLSVAYPDGTHDYFAYDAQGRLISTSGDQAGQLVTYAYDTTGGVTVTDATGARRRSSYGLNGQIAQVRDGEGRIVNLGYNSIDDASQLVGPSGEKYCYSYDAHGNLIGVRDPLQQIDHVHLRRDVQPDHLRHRRPRQRHAVRLRRARQPDLDHLRRRHARELHLRRQRQMS